MNRVRSQEKMKERKKIERGPGTEGLASEKTSSSGPLGPRRAVIALRW